MQDGLGREIDYLRNITVVVLIIWYLFMGIDKVYPTVRKELDERRKNAKQN